MASKHGVLNLKYAIIVIFLLFSKFTPQSICVNITTRVNSIKVYFVPTKREHSLSTEIASKEVFRVVIEGENLTKDVQLALTPNASHRGASCPTLITPPLALQNIRNENDTSFGEVFLPYSVTTDARFTRDVYLCVKTDSQRAQSQHWMHQGEAGKILSSNLRKVANLKNLSFEKPSLPTKFKKWSSKSYQRLSPSQSSLLNIELESNLVSYDSHNDSSSFLESENDTESEVFARTGGSVSHSDGLRTSGTESPFYISETWAESLDNSIDVRSNRRGRDVPTEASEVGSVPSGSSLTDVSPRVYGMRVEKHAKGIEYEKKVIRLQALYKAKLILFGEHLTEELQVQFTSKPDEFGHFCDSSTSDLFRMTSAFGHYAYVTVVLPPMGYLQEAWYLCVRNGTSMSVHQGEADQLKISTYSLFLPLWIQVIILIFLLMLSGLFSGLNLGLMALDKTELKIVMNTGTANEQDYARAIEPIRRHGNFLLCTLLLGNVLVNSSLTILLDTLSSGLVAVIGSTVGIVIFGEIIPQAVCSRHGLAIGAKTVWLVRMFMVLTAVISWPISKMLDLLLGEEIGSTYDRDRLKELIRVTHDQIDIRQDEQNIIYGALELHRKTVTEVMTKLDDVFMLTLESTLDFNTINEIMEQGFSRIPIFEKERTNIVSLLLIKDLAYVDPDDNTPLRTLVQFYENTCNFVFEDTTLDVIFKEFKEGNKGHMAFVHCVKNDVDCDPFYEVVGLVTLEDVIEELIQEEIMDETDVFTDNKSKRRRKLNRRDFKEFSQHNHTNTKRVQISPQLQVAAFQYLRSSLEPFKENEMSETILKRLLNQDIIHIMKCNEPQHTTTMNGPNNTGVGSSAKQAKQNIYTQGKIADYFVLILEGHVHVTIGRENLTFSTGPFTYFGMSALYLPPVATESPSISTQVSRTSIIGSMQSLENTKGTFTPDYSVAPATEVTFLKIRKTHYIAARRACLLERSKKDPTAVDTFEREMEKILRDESLTSPVWENDSKDNSLKRSLLSKVDGRPKSLIVNYQSS